MEKTSLNKIGCGSEKENERVPFFFLIKPAAPRKN